MLDKNSANKDFDISVHSLVDGRNVCKGSCFIVNADGFTFKWSLAGTLSRTANI